MMIGVDIGGTFTDLVAVDGGELNFVKTLSTPQDPAKGVIEGLGLLAERVGSDRDTMLRRVNVFIHGTTVATNMLVQRTGAVLGLITTAGFRDLLELRDGTKRERYRLRLPPPVPLVPRELRKEVVERVRSNGDVETVLDEASVRAAIADLRAAGVAGVVVCLLNAHRNPAHELAIAQLIEKSGWSPYMSLSHQILGREGEFDRLCTALANAYVGPGLDTYLSRLEEQLLSCGIKAPLRIMQSSGGVLPVMDASRRAVGAITSGPAGGAMAGALFARAKNLSRVVTYDMGGTSTDVALIKDGIPLERQTSEVDDLRIAAPAIEIEALGAGGGSIAWIDPSGILALGPQSAGALPGPACYGRGGTRPATSDASVVLNMLSPETFMGGRVPLSRDLSIAALDAHIATPLNLSVEAAAFAIHELATSKITEGIRLATVRRGMDPRDFALISFGGAGGLYANSVARELSIPTVVIPRQASVLSALGFLASDIRYDFHRTVGKPIKAHKNGELRNLFSELAEQGKALLTRDGFPPEKIRTRMVADCRYARQVHTVSVEITAADLDASNTAELLEKRFTQVYRDLYHHAHDDPAIVDNCRLAVFGELSKIDLPLFKAAASTDPAPARRTSRKIFLGEWIDAAVYSFDDLLPNMQIEGPALVDSSSTSVLILPGSSAQIDTYGCICISALKGRA
jgi:N-methylhydantoinase A